MNQATLLALVLLVATVPAYAQSDDAAVEKARAKAEKNPADADAQLALADALIAKGEPEEAWTAIERAMETIKEDGRLDLKLGDIFVMLAARAAAAQSDGTTINNYYLDAGRMYDAALAKSDKLTGAVYGKALVAYQTSGGDEAKVAEARKLLAQCLGMDKDYAKAHRLQAEIFYNERKYQPAADAYEVVLKLDKSDPVDFVRLGHCYLRLEQPAKAQQAYIDVLKHHPEYTGSILSGLLNLAGKKYEASVPYLKAAVDAAPKSPAAWFYYGFALFSNSMNDEALDAFKKAIALRPDNAQYLFYAGFACEKRNDGDKALDYYRKALKANPAYDQPSQRFEGLAVAYRANNFEQMEKLYEELLKLAPGNGWARNNYALFLRDWAEMRGAAKTDNPPTEVRKRIKRSSEVYEEAAAILTKEAQVQSDTGLMFEFYPATFDAEKAEKYFVRALELSEFTYRDAWSGVFRLGTKTKNWELLRDCAEGVLGSLEDNGRVPQAPVGGGSVQEVPNDRPRMISQAKQALAMAESALAKQNKGD